MLELFLVMFAATVQSAGQEMASAAAPVSPPAVSAPAQQAGKSGKSGNAAETAETAAAAPAFLAPAGQSAQSGQSGASGKADNATAEAAPAFLTPRAGAGGTSGTVAPPAFLAPQKTAEAPPAFLAPQKTAEAPPVFLAPSAPAPAAGLVAEPQVPSGRFTTAIEVKPILSATRANWIAVRLYEGRDYLYVTQIWSWRCGLAQLRYGINGGPLQVWPLPPCHEDYSAPNAILEGDGNPMLIFPAGSIATVEIEITYDDLSTETARFSRASVQMP